MVMRQTQRAATGIQTLSGSVSSLCVWLGPTTPDREPSVGESVCKPPKLTVVTSRMGIRVSALRMMCSGKGHASGGCVVPGASALSFALDETSLL